MKETKLTKSQQALVDVHAAGYRVVGRKVRDMNGNSVLIIKPEKSYPFFIAEGKDGKVKITKVHRLLAFQMFGREMFRRGIIVRHYNDKKNDFRRINIRLGTPRQNRADQKRNQKKKLKKTS